MTRPPSAEAGSDGPPEVHACSPSCRVTRRHSLSVSVVPLTVSWHLRATVWTPPSWLLRRRGHRPQATPTVQASAGWHYHPEASWWPEAFVSLRLRD